MAMEGSQSAGVVGDWRGVLGGQLSDLRHVLVAVKVLENVDGLRACIA
jgi:hypothetical protein